MAERSASTMLVGDRWRVILQWLAATVAVEIALHSFIVQEPILTIVMALLWLGAGVVWTRRGGNGGPYAIVALSVFEIVVSTFLTDEVSEGGEVAPWIVVVHIALVLSALVAATMTILRGRTAEPR